jgi:hypothetical protein
MKQLSSNHFKLSPLGMGAFIFNGNAPKYWKRSHSFYSFSQGNGFENTI